MTGSFFGGMQCKSSEANLTKETKMSSAIDKLASPSSVFAECYTKNSLPGAGGNVLNPICKNAYCFYERIYSDTYCKAKETADQDECFNRYVSKGCNQER